jgi:hypothetical protein
MRSMRAFAMEGPPNGAEAALSLRHFRILQVGQASAIQNLQTPALALYVLLAYNGCGSGRSTCRILECRQYNLSANLTRQQTRQSRLANRLALYPGRRSPSSPSHLDQTPFTPNPKPQS